jgi:peroxiredoxin
MIKRTILAVLLVATLILAQTPEETLLVRVGQKVPDFTVQTLNGQTIDMAQLRGKVVLINFFATWCGPCMAEMPEVEKQIWQKFRGPNFLVLAIGREHSEKDLKKFIKKKKFTLPMAADPKREVYSLFAKQFIPRNFLVDKEGKIIYQSTGYTLEEFARLVELVAKSIGD